MKRIYLAFTALVLFSCTEKKEKKPDTGISSFSTDGKKVIVYTTADSTNLRLSATDTLSFATKGQPVESEITVFVDPSKTFQEFIGIGAALTDAAAETYYKLPKDKQQEIIKAFFDKQSGIGYTVGRTNINSCDFSSDMYTYVKEGDKELKTFNIEHDRKYKIPFIKEAMAAAEIGRAHV